MSGSTTKCSGNGRTEADQRLVQRVELRQAERPAGIILPQRTHMTPHA
jgi:hypothetical protein